MVPPVWGLIDRMGDIRYLRLSGTGHEESREGLKSGITFGERSQFIQP
jgi:hypothetical protein